MLCVYIVGWIIFVAKQWNCLKARLTIKSGDIFIAISNFYTKINSELEHGCVYICVFVMKYDEFILPCILWTLLGKLRISHQTVTYYFLFYSILFVFACVLFQKKKPKRVSWSILLILFIFACKAKMPKKLKYTKWVRTKLLGVFVVKSTPLSYFFM